MPIQPNLLLRFDLQSGSLGNLLEGVSEDVLANHSRPEKWSALENLAHLARYHQVFLGRLEQMLGAPGQPLERYRAEDDPEWDYWRALGATELVDQYYGSRREIRLRLEKLSDDQLHHTGIHPAFGALDVPTMLEMFLLHEAHHFYTMFQRIRESRRLN
ncbi:MAG: DinB family protein [Meiothermus sp.]|nr:DinB family protein [Meiothermus sp.]